MDLLCMCHYSMCHSSMCINEWRPTARPLCLLSLLHKKGAGVKSVMLEKKLKRTTPGNFLANSDCFECNAYTLWH